MILFSLLHRQTHIRKRERGGKKRAARGVPSKGGGKKAGFPKVSILSSPVTLFSREEGKGKGKEGKKRRLPRVIFCGQSGGKERGGSIAYSYFSVSRKRRKEEDFVGIGRPQEEEREGS